MVDDLSDSANPFVLLEGCKNIFNIGIRNFEYVILFLFLTFLYFNFLTPVWVKIWVLGRIN